MPRPERVGYQAYPSRKQFEHQHAVLRDASEDTILHTESAMNKTLFAIKVINVRIPNIHLHRHRHH